MPKLILVSNRSPIDYHKGKEAAVSVGGLTQAMFGCLKENDLWVAVSGGDDDPNKVDEHNIINVRYKMQEAERQFLLKKVFLHPELYNRYYNSFSNGFIWPLFHCSTAAHYERSRTFPRPKFDGQDFFGYSRANRVIAEKTLQRAGPDDLLWIQDYHLLLLSEFLRECKPSLQIGQFIHIPAPNPDVLRIYLEQHGGAREGIRYLLKGMQNNNLLGFHTPRDVENFAKFFRFFHPAATTEEHERGITITFNQQKCSVESFPIGTDTAAILSQLDQPLHIPFPHGESSESPKFGESGEAGELSEFSEPGESSLESIIEGDRQKNRLVFVGVERCDYTKGLLERLPIIEKLLEQTNGGVRYIGVIDASSRQTLEAYKELLAAVKEETEKLNRRWQEKLGYQPVIMLYTGAAPPQNYLLLRAADCVLMPLHDDGMNLVLQEAVLSKTGLPHEQRGFITVGHCGAERILSEYGDQHGLVRLFDVLDAEDCASRIQRCITGKYSISDALIAKVTEMDVNTWRDTYLRRLQEVRG